MNASFNSSIFRLVSGLLPWNPETGLASLVLRVFHNLNSFFRVSPVAPQKSFSTVVSSPLNTPADVLKRIDSSVSKAEEEVVEEKEEGLSTFMSVESLPDLDESATSSDESECEEIAVEEASDEMTSQVEVFEESCVDYLKDHMAPFKSLNQKTLEYIKGSNRHSIIFNILYARLSDLASQQARSWEVKQLMKELDEKDKAPGTTFFMLLEMLSRKESRNLLRDIYLSEAGQQTGLIMMLQDLSSNIIWDALDLDEIEQLKATTGFDTILLEHSAIKYPVSDQIAEVMGQIKAKVLETYHSNQQAKLTADQRKEITLFFMSTWEKVIINILNATAASDAEGSMPRRL